jgi:protease IV
MQDENNNNEFQNNQPQRPMPPLPADNVEEKNTQIKSVNKWIKALVILFGLSILASFVVVSRKSSKRIDIKIDKDISKAIYSSTGPGVGWITIRGIISEGDTYSGWDVSSASKIAARIGDMGKNDKVKAIVLDINSPGGTVAAVQEIYSEIMRVRKNFDKPVVALFRDVSASGGYYVASACDKIVAYPGTLTGSIGVIFQVGNLQELFNKIGVKMMSIKSGKFKDIGSPYRQMTDEEKALLQNMIDDTYSQFFDVVQKGRNIPADELKKIADGRIFTGTQALKLKLVDKLGDSTDALQLAGELGGLGPNPKIIREKYDIRSIFSLFELASKSMSKSVLGKVEQVSSPKLSYLWVE